MNAVWLTQWGTGVMCAQHGMNALQLISTAEGSSQPTTSFSSIPPHHATCPASHHLEQQSFRRLLLSHAHLQLPAVLGYR